MTRTRVLASGALRLALLFTGLFVLGAILYVAIVHYAVTHAARGQLAAAIEADLAVGRDIAAREGTGALQRRFAQTPLTLYALVDAAGHRVAGTLPAAAEQVGEHVVTIPWDGTTEDVGEPIELLTHGERLPDGALLVVGRSLFAAGELVEYLDETALWTAAGIVALALAAGWLVAAVFLRRLDRVSAAIDRIVAGAYAERLPPIGMGRELDRLAAQLNAMLDRIIALMEGHRQLSGNIAHDLRTPLARVRRRLEAARESLPGDAGEPVDAALVEIDGLLTTFAALLRLGTIETGALRARFRPVDLSALLAGIEAAFAPVAEDQGKRLVPHVALDARLSGDAALLTQLLTNLVENALIHGGARIALSLAREGPSLVVAVADDGPGIPADERANVLQRFYRLDTGVAAGSGLGLALAAAIVALHDGTLALADNAPGLAVTIRLPALAAAAPEPAPPARRAG